MNKDAVKRAWVAPKLEQIAMVDTQGCPNAMAVKNNQVPESGMCGSGIGS